MAKPPSPKADQLRAMREAKASMAKDVEGLHSSRRPEKVYKAAVNVLKKSAAKRGKKK